MNTASNLPQITLKNARHFNHPWIFQKMVQKPAEKLKGGTLVDIHDSDGTWMGRGFYNWHSRITLRVLTNDPEEQVDETFFSKRISEAVRLRHEVMKLPDVTDAYRLVHSEGDNLSGLVVDRFGDCIVVEYFAAGMYRFRPQIEKALLEHFPNAHFYFFAEEHVQKQEAIDCRSPQAPDPFIVTEHGLKFWVAPGSKHKTGFFVDQRDNRKMLGSFCQGKRVLDICCNTGGFAVYAAAGGADEVVGIDLDETAIESARRNTRLNKVQMKFVHVDLFPWLRDAIARGEQYDVVILDPSKQTRVRDEVDTALRRYMDMNRLALQVVKPGGLFLTCSCTGLVSEEQFMESVRKAAFQANRNLQIFHLSGAGPDHPFLSHVQESRYLKAIWGRVL